MRNICPMNRVLNKKVLLYISIAIMTVVLNVLAWNSTAFCDAYIAFVFPVWVNLYGRFTGLFPFSVGEWMIMTGVLLVVSAVLGLPVLMLALALRWKGGKRFLKGFYCFFAWVLLIVCLVMTLNCFILYHASTFSEHYFGENTKEYTLEDLLKVRNEVVAQCNRLSREVKRGSDGRVIYEEMPITADVPAGLDSGSIVSDVEKGIVGKFEDGRYMDMRDQARMTIAKLGETYPQLDGWYPRPKALLASDFMCQQHMQGYYFPFSMEANYNDVMELMRKPATMCHELAHLRGYIFEDEANFIAYLACIQSDDIYFQYSGYLSVLIYLENDLYHAAKSNPEAYDKAVKQVRPLVVYERVYEDNIFVSEEEWERINGKAVVDTDTVDQMTDRLVDTSLKVNGVADGSISYSRVVKLLLQYYDYGQK